MLHLSAHFVFHPVGQGLFTSGALYGSTHAYPCNHEPSFRWVYDCGTTPSSQKLVTREIDRLYRAASNGVAQSILDLVAISHFDTDHISGLVALLGKFRVRYLLLPYLSLSQRITLAFSQSVPASSPEMGFFLDPVAFISAIESRQVDHILLVPPSDDGHPDNNPDDNGNTPREAADAPWELIFEEVEPNAQEQQESGGFNPTVHLLRPGSALQIARHWEFVPYNDSASFPAPPKSFLDTVIAVRDTLLDATNAVARDAALAQLKAIYDNQFGKKPRQRNGISLHLYGGPLGRTQAIGSEHSCSQPLVHHWGHPRHCVPGCCCLGGVVKNEGNKLGILYTGDGYLNTQKKLKRLMNYLGIPHRRDLFCFQVMHHGAKGNWRAGVAAKLDPAISVFSSNPNDGKYHHPHFPVWKDFEHFGRKQVNEDCGLSVSAHYW